MKHLEVVKIWTLGCVRWSSEIKMEGVATEVDVWAAPVRKNRLEAEDSSGELGGEDEPSGGSAIAA